MTCKQLGGACDFEFVANSFEEMARLSQQHGMEMVQSGDIDHEDAMNEMKKLMGTPNGMEKWMAQKKKEFDNSPEL